MFQRIEERRAGMSADDFEPGQKLLRRQFGFETFHHQCGASGPFLFLVALSAQAAVGYRYIRLPIKALTPQFVATTGFIRDHKVDDTYAFGYLRSDLPLSTLLRGTEIVQHGEHLSRGEFELFRDVGDVSHI